VPGIVLGSLLAASVPDILLRPTLGAMLLIAGGRMVA
jgi:uncharacterized membrane protein YfcA